MRLPVAKVFLAFLFALIVGGMAVGGSRVLAQTTASVTPGGSSLSQTDRIAALEKQNAENAALIAAAQTSGDNAWMLVLPRSC